MPENGGNLKEKSQMWHFKGLPEKKAVELLWSDV